MRGQSFQGEIRQHAREVPVDGGVRRQTALCSHGAEREPRRSTGLSEAEDWLGREAARPSGDSEGDLYKRQAVVKNRKPSTCGERGSWLDHTRAACPAPAPL